MQFEEPDMLVALTSLALIGLALHTRSIYVSAMRAMLAEGEADKRR